MYSSTPIFASPIEFNIPEDVSTILGGGLPSLGSLVIDFVTTAPRFLISASSDTSLP